MTVNPFVLQLQYLCPFVFQVVSAAVVLFPFLSLGYGAAFRLKSRIRADTPAIELSSL